MRPDKNVCYFRLCKYRLFVLLYIRKYKEASKRKCHSILPNLLPKILKIEISYTYFHVYFIKLKTGQRKYHICGSCRFIFRFDRRITKRKIESHYPLFLFQLAIIIMNKIVIYHCIVFCFCGHGVNDNKRKIFFWSKLLFTHGEAVIKKQKSYSGLISFSAFAISKKK